MSEIDRFLSPLPVVDDVGAVDGVCCVVCLVLKGKPCKDLDAGQVHEARRACLALVRFPLAMAPGGSDP